MTQVISAKFCAEEQISCVFILYQIVTRRVHFKAETPMAIVVKHITEPLTRPSALNPNLPEGVERNA